ncbi:MAG TPA: class I SAM-dependent methyltransferase [bacterium]|nr:class I SAM-dependent methyltransferase [bacterium]
MFFKIYIFLRRLFLGKGVRPGLSEGYLPDRIRESALEVLLGADGKLLEVGCGEGRFLTELLKRNGKIFAAGVDMSPEMLGLCRDNARSSGVDKRLVLHHSRGEELPFLEGEFDYAVAVNTLYNLSRDSAKKVIGEMARVLGHKGRLVFDFKNALNPVMRLKYFFAPFYDPVFGSGEKRLIAYRKKEIETVLSGYGLKIIDLKRKGFLIPFFYLVVAEKE